MIRIGHASKGETGITNQIAGDQTGGEVKIANWYKKPWNCLIRANNPEMAEKIAKASEQICRNDCIGYDQNNRNDIITFGELVDWDFSQINTPIECDCSSFVSACVIASGIDKDVVYKKGNACTTRNLRKSLLDTKEFEEFTDDEHTNTDEQLKRGDILLSEGHHVAVVLDTSEPKEDKKVDEKAKDDEKFPKYKGYSPSIVTALTEIGCKNVSKAYRAKIAVKNGIIQSESEFNSPTINYDANTVLLKKLKEGTLIKP